MNTASTTALPSSSRRWNIGLWATQIALAAIYAMAGFNKLTLSPDALVQMGMGFAADTPIWLLRFIGTAEVLGMLGMLLPAATRILPRLTPLAGLGLAVIQVLAIGVHVTRGELGILPFNFVLLAAAVFVFWGRQTKAPIAARL